MALTETEARDATGVDLARDGVQPVWLKVSNREGIGYVIPPMVIDHDYFSPMEVAWRAHGWLTPERNARIDDYFRKLRLPFRIEPGETVSGFVFTNRDEGVKYVSVELEGRQVRDFNFLARVPDIKIDYTQVQGEIEKNELYKRGEIRKLDEATFRA